MTMPQSKPGGSNVECGGGGREAREANARRTEVEMRILRKSEEDLGEGASLLWRSSCSSSWRSFWMSLNEEQEKLRERCDGDGGGVLRTRLGELSHGGHMERGSVKRQKVVSGKKGGACVERKGFVILKGMKMK
ncbi:hypothetical protein PIB30_017794 [Stylosanthes scabra]|uniref:Uncharacterized protein n=1 Tax=Stylosanthes scabra TaxID=79078 RepID=A0ABU6U6N6_9FABA|nr:hypothetical protein [Stylosanthes scabra]